MGISIIIAAYNAEKYIKKCISSILCQGEYDYEVIIVDDGSLDGTGKICDDFALQNSKVWVLHQINGGVSSARNAGLAQCTKEYVTFVDSDDYFESTALEAMIKDIDTLPDVTLWSYNYYNVYKDKRIPTPFEAGIKDKDSFINGMLRYNGTGCVGGKLFRTSIAKQCAFPSTLKMGEDTKFILEYMAKSSGDIYISPSIIYNYVQVESSATHRKDYLKEYTKLNDEMIDYFRDDNVNEARKESLAYYVSTNIFAKLSGGCSDFSRKEKEYARKNKTYIIKRFVTVNRKVMQIFLFSPKIAIWALLLVNRLRNLKYGGN